MLKRFSSRRNTFLIKPTFSPAILPGHSRSPVTVHPIAGCEFAGYTTGVHGELHESNANYYMDY